MESGEPGAPSAIAQVCREKECTCTITGYVLVDQSDPRRGFRAETIRGVGRAAMGADCPAHGANFCASCDLPGFSPPDSAGVCR